VRARTHRRGLNIDVLLIIKILIGTSHNVYYIKILYYTAKCVYTVYLNNIYIYYIVCYARSMKWNIIYINTRGGRCINIRLLRSHSDVYNIIFRRPERPSYAIIHLLRTISNVLPLRQCDIIVRYEKSNSAESCSARTAQDASVKVAVHIVWLRHQHRYIIIQGYLIF